MRIRKSAEERKSEVVSAALKLAEKIGPDRVTTETLAEAVGLTQAGLFRHFPKKQDIWEEVADYIGRQMEKRWARAERREADPPEDRLGRLVLSQLRLIQSFPAIPAILFSRELQVENERLRKAFIALMGQFHQRLTRIVIEAQQGRCFRSDQDPGDVAYVLVALVQGLAVRWSITAHGFPLLKEGQRLLELQLDGFRGPLRATSSP